MLQTKIFLSNYVGDSSFFCRAEDYFNAWVAENPNIEIKDVKYQHVMTDGDDYVKQSSSIMVLFEVQDGSKPYSRFNWNSVWNRRLLFEREMQDSSWISDKLEEEPTFPLVGNLPETYTPVLVKVADGWYRVTVLKQDSRGCYYFEGIDAEHFSWQYLPE